MKKIGIILLALCLLFGGAAQGEEGLPTLRLAASQLDYVAPRPGTLQVEGNELSVTVKYRGTYSFTFSGKRNYSLHIKYPDGSPRKLSLLGLRRDDDYVLLGGLSDGSRLRNPVGLALWRAMGHAAPDTAACELYFGPYYKGIYFLTERPDRKSAGVPEDGALYRVLAAGVAGVDLLSAADPPPPQGDTWCNVGREYPQEDGWEPLAVLVRGQAALDLNAFADYYLYVNLIGASDNMTKNLYLCWDGQAFYPMPWDLDAAFGRLYNAEPSDPDAWYGSAFYDGLLARADFAALLRQRWQQWRQLLSPDSVMALFDRWNASLEASGAWEREMERFPDYTDSVTGVTHPLDPRSERAFIAAYLAGRYALLDAAFGGEP